MTTSHSLITPSSDPDTSIFPFGEKSKDIMQLEWPLSVFKIEPFVLHSFNVMSIYPDANICPFREKDIVVTA